jgi:hypothetical protein
MMAGTSPAGFFSKVPLRKGGSSHFSDNTNDFIAEHIGTSDLCGSVSYTVESGDCCPPQFYSSMSRLKRQGWIYPTPMIEYDQKVGTRLWATVRSLAWRERWRDLAYSELDGVAEPYRSALHSFLVNIWAYHEAVPDENRDLGLIYILEQSLKRGPEFAQWIDGLKSYLLTIKGGRENLAPDIVDTYRWEGTSPKFISIGHIYRANQLFNWTPPHPDIREITNEPLELESWAVDMFRTGIKKVLENPKYHFFLPNNDYGTAMKDNTKMAQEGPQWQLAPVRPAVVRGKSRVAFIPRELKEARAAIIEEHDSLIRIRWIDHEVRRVLNADNRSVMNLRPGPLRAKLIDAIKERKRFNHKTRRKENSERWSYCRDFKKEGLTKPRLLLRVMMEELHRRFPTADAFKPYYFFDSWEVFDDEGSWRPPRGHGLGMANSLTTLMQLGIEEMTLSRIEGDAGLKFSAYNNDDAALVFDSEQHTREYLSLDWNSCDALGLKYKAKSTFIARQHLVLCEQYVSTDDRINDKSAFSYATLANLLKCVNASHARNMCLSMNLMGVPVRFAHETVNYWGSILFSNEYQRPRVAGGWFRSVERGVDVSFIQENALNRLPQMEEAASYAYRETALSFTPWRKVKVPSKRSMIYPTDWLEQRGEKLFLENEEVFRPEHNATEFCRAWTMFEKKLKTNFSKACRWWQKNPSRRMTWRDLYRREVDERPKEDILPPLFERRDLGSFEASFTDDTEFEHPYRAARADIDLWSYKVNALPDSYPRRMGIHDPLQVGSRDLQGFKHGSAQRALSMRHLYGLTKVPLKVWNLYLVPNEDSFHYWHNPFAVGCVADAYSRNYNTFVPVYDSEAKRKLLDLRDSYYGRKLSWWEWMTIGQVHPADVFVLWLVRESWNTNEADHAKDALETLVKGMKMYPGLGEFVAGHNWSHDNIADMYHYWCLAHDKLRGEKEDREREKAHKRILEAEMCRVQDEFKPEALDEAFLDDFYKSREEGFHPEEDLEGEEEEDLETFFKGIDELPETETIRLWEPRAQTPEEEFDPNAPLDWEKDLEEPSYPESDEEVAPWDED